MSVTVDMEGVVLTKLWVSDSDVRLRRRECSDPHDRKFGVVSEKELLRVRIFDEVEGTGWWQDVSPLKKL